MRISRDCRVASLRLAPRNDIMNNALKISLAISITALLVFSAAKYGVTADQNDSLSNQIREYTKSGDTVTLRLKSGGAVTGQIKKYTNNGLELDIGFGTTVITNSDIHKIELSNSAEIQQWQEYSTNEEPKIRDDRLKKEEDDFFTRIEEAGRIKQEAEKKRNMVTNIRFQEQSRIIVDAVLDGDVKIKLLVDTGATLVTISPKTAKTLGIDIKNQETVSAELADGRLGQIVPVTLRSVRVGNSLAENVEAGILIGHTQRSGADGLLGMSFLKNFHMTIDAKKKVLTLIKK